MTSYFWRRRWICRALRLGRRFVGVAGERPCHSDGINGILGVSENRQLWARPQRFRCCGRRCRHSIYPSSAHLTFALRSLVLVALSPLLLTVSLGIKLKSPGPILFRQNRHGYNNEIIPVVKFRTMNVVEDGKSSATFTQARSNDDRLTRLGRFCVGPISTSCRSYSTCYVEKCRSSVQGPTLLRSIRCFASGSCRIRVDTMSSQA